VRLIWLPCVTLPALDELDEDELSDELEDELDELEAAEELDCDAELLDDDWLETLELEDSELEVVELLTALEAVELAPTELLDDAPLSPDPPQPASVASSHVTHIAVRQRDLIAAKELFVAVAGASCMALFIFMTADGFPTRKAIDALHHAAHDRHKLSGPGHRNRQVQIR